MGSLQDLPHVDMTRPITKFASNVVTTERVADMHEALDVAHAVGATPKVSVEKRMAGAAKVGEHRTSTLQDLLAGKPLERGPIIDAVIELADMTGVDVPSLRAIGASCGLLAESMGLA